ncbi:2-hydroxyacyl-CoA dehydratase [Desulfosporosinus fructosivorans]|uniref:2-hydroxyacyl-CoA dehydratase n=1 Tax=Desulfosporosinus fructosivorans TaxID=2018669 RepID=A0A4Z0R3Q2_9FIRM|nr:2-hydroxyacyl-CoA dehydratase family protein [Desulfosporosinus fructosivorans]TGE37015.1 2-hydroxyacyl-CoA dehydratase [Desulfosporosinus fructosivorans]
MKESIKVLIKQAMSNKDVRNQIIKQLSSEETIAAVKKRLTKKYKGSLKDQWVDFKYWMKVWHVCLGTTKPDQKKMLNAMLEYPWMLDLLKTTSMGKRYTEGRTGIALKMTWKTVLLQAGATIEQLQNVILDPENTILAQVMVPTQIYKAMGLKYFICETPANTMVMMDQHCHEKYIDNSVNNGLPDDTCTYASQTPGVVLAGDLPNPHTVMVCSNLPCEAGFASYAIMERELGVPTYRLDVPYNFREEGAREAYIKDLKGMIAFLEEHTGHKIDWEKLKEECEIVNQLNEIELERWEMNRSETPPLCNDVLWFPHLCFFQLDAGRADALELFKELQKLGRRAHYFKECSVKPLKYRAILWNPPTFGYSYFWSWLERCWGIGIVNDMETFGTLNFIDTSSPDSMLAGLGEQWCNAAMSRHTRGPAENWMGDLAKVNEMYRPDFILNLNHMGCRSSLGLTGAMIDWANEKDVSNCIVNYNMYDSRVVSRQGIRDQINNFMTNIMHAEPLDSSLLVFDDSNDW